MNNMTSTGYYIRTHGIVCLILDGNKEPTYEDYVKAEEIIKKCDKTEPHWQLKLEIALEEIFIFGVSAFEVTTTKCMNKE